MIKRNRHKHRQGSVLVEYALLVAGIVLVSVVAIAVLGHKVASNFGVMAAVIPGAHTDDNKPIGHPELLPFQDDGSGKLVLNSGALVGPQGVDRMQSLLGPGGAGQAGELLIVD